MEIINLDMTPSTVTPNAHAGQYDASRIVRFMLKNGGVPFTLAGTETITAKITRSDNTEVTVNVENTSSNYVDVVFDDTVCTVKGLYACELRLKDSDGFDIGSKNFALLVQRDPYDGAGIRVETVGPADVCTFETTLAEPLQSVLVNVEATGGNGTPDNPNPINGYTEANITRCGVNLFDNEFSNYRKPVNYYIKNIPLEVGKSYTLKATLKSGGTAVSGCYFGVAAKGEQYSEFLPELYPCVKTDGTVSTSTLNITSAWTSPKLVCYVANETQFNSIMENYDISLTEGTADFTPYNGQTYTIAFGQTVYGGVLNVTRGKLHGTWGDVDLGSLSWTHRTDVAQGVFAAQLLDYKFSSDVQAKCDIYAFGGTTVASGVPSKGNNSISFYYDAQQTARYVYVYNTSYSDANAFKTAMSGHKLVYELATPFDIDLTPEVISAVVGENNVFADCGQTTVKYLKAGA